MIDDGAMIARARAECRFGGEGCELPPTDGKTRTGAKNGEANGKSVNFFKGMLLGVDTRQSRDDFINRPREARERRSPSPRPKREKPKPKAAPPPPPPPPPPPAKEDSASAISRLLDGLTNGSDVHDEPELSTSPLIKRVDNPMGVSFRVEPLALLEAWRGTDGGVKTVDDGWRVRALRAEEALRAERNDCGDCHKRRATAEAALEEHTRWLGEERSAKAALEQELNDLKAHMEKKIQELTANAEKDRVKAKRSLEAAIEAANRVTKQNALDERRKRDQLDDLNAKLKKDIIELEKINANAQERISKLEIELKSSYDIKSSINISISTNEAFAKLEDDKHKLEIENAALKKSLDGKSEEVDRLKDELNALRVRINAVTGERDSATKELQTTSKKLTSEIKLLTKELEQSQSTTTVIERKLKESIESHVRETTIIRTKITQSEKSRKRDRTKFDTDRTNLRAEISRLMRLLSKAESREESVRGRKHLIEEELQVCRAKIRDLMTSDRHTLHYNSNQGVPDVERTLIERRTGLTFAHLTSRMQNFALKTRMLEYLDTIEKLRKDEVESQVQLKSKEELQSRDNERNAALIDELRKEIATLRDASEKLDADHSAAQQAHSAHVIKSNTIIAQLRQQISDGEAALQELKHSSTEAFKSAQASMESQKQAAADSLGLLESSLKSKDAEILELKTDHASYIRDLRSRDEKIDSLSDQITGIERELESRTAELSDRRAALGVAKWRASIRGTSLKNAYDALLVKLTNTETELKTVCELREKDQRRVQALENEIAKKYPVRATDGETAAVPSMSEADQLKMAQLEKQCKQLRAKNEEDVAKYRRLLREKDKEFTLVKQNEAAKLREAYNIINTQSVDLSRLDIKSKQLEVAVSESTKSTLMAEQHKVSVTKSIREVTQRCQILEEKHIKIQHVESMRPVETRAADVSAQQLQAQIAELRLQLDFKTSESDARDRQLRGSHAANVKEWQQKVEFLQNDLLNMTASRDSAKSELLALADELSVLKHQYNVNAEFSATRERDMAQANDTLRSSLDSAVKGTESINRRYLSLQDKAEATNAELTKRNDELRAIIAKLRGDHAECLDVRDKRIVTLEGMLQEYQSSLHETKTRYSRDLEGEVARLQSRLTSEQAAHASAIANGRSERARLRWAAMYSKSRIIQKHARFYAVSKDFSRSMKEEYRQHAAAATATIRSLDKTIKRLEKDLSDMMASKESLAESVVELEKRLAEGDSEHRSKLATLRWSHFARFLRFKARHNRFFQNSKQFAAALKNEVRESDAFKFNNELALAARDNRIQALEKMVSEYQESLHETKTRYSRELEGEISTLRERIDVLQSELATSRWTALCSLLRTRKRHLRFLNTSKDFAKSMKTEYRLHAEGTTKTVRSLGDTIAALKKELADMVSKNKSLEGTIAKSKTDLKEMHKQSKQFETQIEQMQGEMFQTDGAMKARDERIGVLEGMVESYQNSLHETKTAYSRSLEQEIKDIRDAWKAEAEAHVASKRDRVRIRWSMLANELRLRNRGIRFTHTARDFVKSMRTEYRLHAEASTKTVRSLGDTVAALKNDLEGSKKSKSKVDEELKMLRKRRDDNLNVMKKQFEEAEKNRASIEKQSERTINSLNDEIRNLKKQLENEVAKNLGIKKASEARIEELQQLIASLEDGMKELQSSAESTKARLSSEESRLRSECATLRNRLDETSSLYAGLQETSSAKLAAARWRLLLTNVKQRDRHDRFFDTSKDFTRGMRADHKLYVEFTQRTITSLNESNAKLKQRADDAAKKEEAHQDEITTLKGKMASDESQARMKVEDLEEKLSESGKLAKQLNRDLDTLDKDSKKRYDEAVKVSRREADALRETIRDLEKKLDNANRSARKTDEKNKSEVEKLRAKFESLKKKDVDQRRITELEALVKRLEASIDEHEKLLTAARHTHKDEIEEKEARINELELERQRLETAISEYETSLESTRSSSSGQVSRLHGELRILREQLDESNTTRAKALVQAKSERAALHWSWMCRVLRARRLHQRHVALVKSFTSAELVEARSWAATSDKTIRSLNDQMLEVKAKLKALEDLDETVRVRDARVAELELLLQEAQSSMDSTKSTASSELQRLQDEKANLVAQLDDLQNQLKLDAEKAKSRAQSMKSDYDKQIEDLRTRARIDADESAAREHQAQVDFKNQLDDLAERLKNKSKSDATFEHARFLQMKEEYEKQLEDLRKRMKADADSAEARAQQSQADFEQQLRAAADEAAERELEAQANFKTLLESLSARHKAKAASDAEDSESRYQLMVANFEQQLGELRERMRAEAADAAKRAEQAHADFEQQIADLVQIQKKELTVLKFRHASTLGLRDSRVEELERLLLEHETELEKSKSSMSGDAITTRRELSELRMQYEDFKAQSAVDAEDAARVAQRLEQELDVLRKRCVSLERTHDDAMMHTKSERAALRWRTTCRILQVKEGHRRFLNIALGHSKATLRELVAHRNTAQITIHSLQDKLDGMQKRLAGATESEASSEARERTLQEEIINLKLKISQLEKEKIRVSYEMTKSQAIIGQRDETISDLEKMLLTGGEQSVGLAAAQEKIKRLERDFNDLQSRAMADAASAAKRLADMEGKQYGLNKSERAQLRWAALLRCTIRDVRNKRLLSLASSFAGSLKTELKVHGEVATRTIHTLQADLDELRKQVPASANADEERKMLETKLAALQEKLAELKAKQSIIPSLQSELDALKAKSAEHVSEKELLEKELDLLRRQLSDAERVKGKNTGVNDELVKTLRQRISELEQEIISIERKHAAAVEKIISDHSFAIGKEIKDRENAARDYARIIEDLEGDLVEMTDSRDVAVSDMMKLRLRLDELERGAKDKSQASSSNDPDLLREIHVLRTKVEHLETELVTERTKREREVHALREKLSSREREATAAMTATNVASEETMRVKKELHLKITSQTTLIERLELQVKELKAEYESTQNELGAEAERVSSKSADLISAGKKLNDENVSLKEELDEALAELERLRVAKDFITKEFNFFQIEARQNADLIQRKLERTQEQLNDAEVELAKLRAQVQEYAAEQEELMFESQRIQKASDAKITKLRSELSNVRIEYEEDLRGKLAALKERISDLEDELSDEREKSVKAIAAAKLEAAGATGDSAATRAKIHDLEIELASTREEVTTLEDEIKSSQEAVEYAENWARMNDKRAQGAEEFLITLKVEIAELKRALVLAKSQPHDDGTAELQKLLDECHETCKSQLAELNELRSERDKLMARPEPKMADPNVGSTTVNFDLGDEPTFEMPEIPKRPEPEPVEPIRSAPSPTSKPTVVYDVEESMERRYGSRVEIATTYDTEVEDEPSEDGEQEEEPGYLEETEEILEIVEYDSDGNEIIVESRALAPGESVDESVLDDEPEKEPEQPVARRSGLWGRFGGAVDDIME